MAVGFGILGPLRVLENGRELDPGSRKQQILLAALLSHANTRLSADALVEALWDDAPPRTARKNLQVYVCGLRRLVGAEPGSTTEPAGPPGNVPEPAAPAARISHQAGGYVLHTAEDGLDALRFERRARAGALDEALRLWRGPALDGFRDVPLIDAAAQRLDRRHLSVFEDWLDAELAAGRGAVAIERATETAQRHPLRERLRMLQMTALCQAGRRSEALAVYDELRQLLAQELGLPPSPALARFYRALLCDAGPVLPRPAAPTVPAAAPDALPGAVGPPGALGAVGPAGAVGAAGPPAAEGEVPPHLLPTDPPAFTGRTAAVHRLTEALTGDAGRLAVLTGPLGAGKTALAVHTAHRLGERFPDGRLFVRLRGDDGRLRPLEDVLRQLLAAAGRGGAPPGPAHRSDPRWAWQLWLTGRRALVVVDDARRESEVRPLLPEAGGSAVVVTARPRLIGLEGAHRFSLPPFSEDEAVEFLGRTIGADRVEADRDSAARIVRAAGLLPLGVRLVADRLAFLRHVPLSEYGARLTGGRALLDELCGGDPLVRVRLAGSVGELPEAGHRAVLRLGLLPGPVFTPEQAAEVLDCDAGTAARTLEGLLEASLLTVAGADGPASGPADGHPDGAASAPSGAVRFAMPALLYAYARERAARAAERVPVRHR
ncbi:BTAD domain-containing putative transcriptional regulator [Kitasatospora sp. NPDC008115]|uniref:AfsR/SARP family transcriptional regulator n=1 Tax=Kitasatospora sp. NPDC008115 TaxID=3364022 RepID=UPI0036E01D37